MKRCVCLLLIMMLLTGCRSLYPDDYLSVESNQAPYAYKETGAAKNEEPGKTEPQKVTTLGEIRQGIRDLVSTGKTSGRFLLHDYRGNPENLTQTVRRNLLYLTPKYVYAMQDLEITAEESGEDILLDVRFTPTISPEELASILTIQYNKSFTQIYEALEKNLSSFTIEIHSYTDTDYAMLLEEYCIEHPDQIIEVPQISMQIFPEDEGSVRVLTFQFNYKTTLDNLQWQQKTVKSLLEIFQVQFREDDDAENLLEDLYMLLVPASGYKSYKDATIYSLFMSKVGSSRAMSSVAAYFCSHAGKECGVVIGERKSDRDEKATETAWEPWYWNWIRDGDRCLFFDLHLAALNGTKPELLTAEEMTDYRWDAEKYRDLETTVLEPVETEPTEPETEQPESPEPDRPEPETTVPETAVEPTEITTETP